MTGNNVLEESPREQSWSSLGTILNLSEWKTTERVKHDIRRLRRGSNLISPEYK